MKSNDGPRPGEDFLDFALRVVDEGEAARRGRRKKASEEAVRSARIAAEVAAERKKGQSE